LRCLVIADDPDTARYICNGLMDAAFTVALCRDGPGGLRRATGDAWDVVIVDRQLPDGVDGISIVGKLRALGSVTPVLIVSALTNMEECVRGLQHGGDDYLPKPFALPELLARIESLLRRARTSREIGQLKIANLTLDTRTLSVSRGPTSIRLQPAELRLLACLMRHAGEVVTRTVLLEQVWGRGYDFDPQASVIDVQISRLRRKVDRGYSPCLIHTVRGVGYLFGVRA
jgi:two-component system, OmpR family, response regulator